MTVPPIWRTWRNGCEEVEQLIILALLSFLLDLSSLQFKFVRCSFAICFFFDNVFFRYFCSESYTYNT